MNVTSELNGIEYTVLVALKTSKMTKYFLLEKHTQNAVYFFHCQQCFQNQI